MARLVRLLALAACVASTACAALHPPRNASDCPALRTEHVHHFEHACLHGGAEPPNTGRYVGGHEKHRQMRGTFMCACCGAPLFPGDARYDSATGWPSFWGTVGPGAVSLKTRGVLFAGRATHVSCGSCGAHLGTVARDGPPPTRQRYRVDSVCLHHDVGSTPLRKAYDEVSHTWHEAKRGPKGPKQGLMDRAKVGAAVIRGAAGDALPGLLSGVGGAVALVAVCFFADVMAHGGKRARKPARRRFGPGGKLMRGDAAL